MEDKELSVLLREEARNLGLCDQWFGEWEDDTDMQGLYEKWVKGFDFALKHDWPSDEFVERHFPEEFRHKNRVFVNECFEALGENGTWIISNCIGLTEFGFYDAATVYVRHGSQLRVKANDNAIIVVVAYDDSVVYATCGDNAKLSVILRGNAVCIVKSGSVKVIDKR